MCHYSLINVVVSIPFWHWIKTKTQVTCKIPSCDEFLSSGGPLRNWFLLDSSNCKCRLSCASQHSPPRTLIVQLSILCSIPPPAFSGWVVPSFRQEPSWLPTDSRIWPTAFQPRFKLLSPSLSCNLAAPRSQPHLPSHHTKFGIYPLNLRTPFRTNSEDPNSNAKTLSSNP